MRPLTSVLRQAQQRLRPLQPLWNAWDRFWFTPSDGRTLAIIRIIAGVLLLWNLGAYTLDLPEFFGRDGWINLEFWRTRWRTPVSWSYFDVFTGGWQLYAVHACGLLVALLLTVGLWTRVVTIAAMLVHLMYVNRNIGITYGVDSIMSFLFLYLCLGAAGDYLSVDAWRRRRRDPRFVPTPRASTTVAIRLLQLHVCLVYLNAGLAKHGPAWTQGGALWTVLMNTEEQFYFDLRWLAPYVDFLALMGFFVVLWEVFFGALVWNRKLRPYILALTFGMQAGLGFFLNLMMFQVAMAAACIAFVEPEAWTRWRRVRP